MTIPDITKLALIDMPIGEIAPYKNNPREHPERQIEMLARSIERYGFNAPVLITPERVLIAGHGRLEAAKRLGMTEVPAIVLAHLSESEQRAYRIADNAISLKGEWSLDLLAAEFEMLAEQDFDFEPIEIGFETMEFDGVVARKGGNKEKEKGAVKADAVPMPNRDQAPVSEPGTIWSTTDGRYRIICGDARDPAVYQRLLGDRKADMVVSDMPFNVKVDGHVSGLGAVHHPEFAMASGEMSEAEFTAFIETVFGQQIAFSRPGSVHLQFIDWRSVDLMIAAGKRVYDKLLNLCVWVKPNGGMGSLWRSRHELVCAFRAPGAGHVNNVQLGKHGRNRTNVWEYQGVNGFREGRMDDLAAHPTCKPVDLVADAIMDVTDRNDLVLDAFLGSGTTLIAARRAGRRGAGIEIDPHYVDVAVQRFMAASGLEMLREDGMRFADLAAGDAALGIAAE